MIRPPSIPLSKLFRSLLSKSGTKIYPPKSAQPLLCWSSALLLVIGSCWIIPYGDFRQMGTVPQFWLGIGIMSLGFVSSWWLKSLSASWFWGVAIATRVLLLWMYPGDDIWRYLWEGHIQTLGFSPYALAPNAPVLAQHHTDWWSLINHRDISAIYPPVTQWGFRLLAQINPSVWLFKAAFTLADLGICWGLSRRFGYQRTLLYAWNPLVIYSFAGGGHYDSWFLFPLVLAWLVFDVPDTDGATEIASNLKESEETDPVLLPKTPQKASRQWGLSALLIGVSVAVKWISLPTLGFLLWQALRYPSGPHQGSITAGKNRAWLKRWAIILSCGALPLLITALPFCTVDACPLIPVGSSFVSYGRSAELVPHFVQLIWPPSLKENWLYAFPLGLAVMWLLVRSRTLLRFIETYLIFLLILSPVIHAWYFTWLVPFAVASRNLGVRLVSVSVFVYFVLQQRIALDGPWQLTAIERTILWGPFLLGWLWSLIREAQLHRSPSA